METAIIVVLSIVLILVFGLAFCVRYSEFREEMDFIELEMERCSRASRKHWKREKRKLWRWFLFGVPRT